MTPATPAYALEIKLYARQALSVLLEEHNLFVRMSDIIVDDLVDRDGHHLRVQWKDRSGTIYAEAGFYPDRFGGMMHLYRLQAPGKPATRLNPRQRDTFASLDHHGLPRLTGFILKA